MFRFSELAKTYDARLARSPANYYWGGIDSAVIIETHTMTHKHASIYTIYLRLFEIASG